MIAEIRTSTTARTKPTAPGSGAPVRGRSTRVASPGIDGRPSNRRFITTIALRGIVIPTAALHSRRGAVALAAVLLVVATPIAAATATDATRQPSATREIAPSSAAPGEGVTVEVTVEVPEDEDRMAVQESFDPALSNVTVQDVEFANGDGSVLLSAPNSDGLTVALGDVSAGTTVTVVYTAEVPTDVPADTVTFDGRVTEDGTDTPIGGDGSVTVEGGGVTTTTTGSTTTTDSTTTDSTTTDSTTTTGSDTTTATTPGPTTTGGPTPTTTGDGTTTGGGTTADGTTGDGTTTDAGTTADDPGAGDGGGGGLLPIVGALVVVGLLGAGGYLYYRQSGDEETGLAGIGDDSGSADPGGDGSDGDDEGL